MALILSATLHVLPMLILALIPASLIEEMPVVGADVESPVNISTVEWEEDVPDAAVEEPPPDEPPPIAEEAPPDAPTEPVDPPVSADPPIAEDAAKLPFELTPEELALLQPKTGAGPTGDTEAEAEQKATKTGGKKTSKGQTACPAANPAIVSLGERQWSVERELVEYYATHIKELMKLGSVWTHRDANGKLDGFKVGLPRCSLLRQAGLRSGDVIHDINGRKVYNVPQALMAYFALRKESNIQVRISRKGQSYTMKYTLIEKAKK